MIHFCHEGSEYDLKFSYEPVEVQVKRREPRATRITLWEREAVQLELLDRYGTAINGVAVVRHHKDPQSWEAGRRAALAKLGRSIAAQMLNSDAVFCRSFRKAMWEAYLASKERRKEKPKLHKCAVTQ